MKKWCYLKFIAVEADPSLLLTDIAEVSEKSATSLGSKRSKKYTLKVKPESEEQMHELTSLLGLFYLIFRMNFA